MSDTAHENHRQAVYAHTHKALVRDSENGAVRVSGDGDTITVETPSGPVYVTVSLTPPDVDPPEVIVLLEMDAALKLDQSSELTGPDLRRKIISERRQIARQLRQIRGQLADAKADATGKLGELEGREWDDDPS